MKHLWSLTWREAQTQTYADAFLVIAACFVIATLMVPLMRKVVAPATESLSECLHRSRQPGEGGQVWHFEICEDRGWWRGAGARSALATT